MKKKKTFLTSRNSLLSLFIISISLLLSCNNNKGPDKTNDNADTLTHKKDSSAQTVSSANSFCTLKLDSASLATLLSDNNAKKILVQFIDSNSTSSCLNMIAYGAKKDDTKTSGPIGLVALSNPPTTFNGTVILGDQELTLKNIKTVLGLGGGSGHINPAKLKDLQFVPLKDGSNHVYYSVTVLGMTEASGSALTNPSPPAPPCENGCDY